MKEEEEEEEEARSNDVRIFGLVTRVVHEMRWPVSSPN